ncbi:hypothetical protein [Roseovarius sp. A-2]|uniref:hypothetical protein n=1 Tax=Roseovarius sp. A-2 TaxID=1570360 RepID=UPI0015940895|nr:hypothetical protein [Roseovarius sp. A-2]
MVSPASRGGILYVIEGTTLGRARIDRDTFRRLAGWRARLDRPKPLVDTRLP